MSAISMCTSAPMSIKAQGGDPCVIARLDVAVEGRYSNQASNDSAAQRVLSAGRSAPAASRLGKKRLEEIIDGEKLAATTRSCAPMVKIPRRKIGNAKLSTCMYAVACVASWRGCCAPWHFKFVEIRRRCQLLGSTSTAGRDNALLSLCRRGRLKAWHNALSWYWRHEAKAQNVVAARR